jgi:fused signal recognition particle receptor
MGFFSSIKKFFGAENTPKEEDTTQAHSLAHEEQASPDEAQPEGINEPAPQTEPSPQPEAPLPAQEQTNDSAALAPETAEPDKALEPDAEQVNQAVAAAQAQQVAQEALRLAKEQAQQRAAAEQAQAAQEQAAAQAAQEALRLAEEQAQQRAAEEQAQAEQAAQKAQRLAEEQAQAAREQARLAEEQAQQRAAAEQAQAAKEQAAAQAAQEAQRLAEEQAAAQQARDHDAAQSPTPTAADDAESAMTLRLRAAEPRLSAWLAVILEGVTEADALLWQRLRFLLHALDAPADETDRFVNDFQAWLERMEYRWLEEFRSELQYRLALALDLEDEEDERSRLFIKLTEGLSRTREQFSKQMDALFSGHTALDDHFWEEMEELFIMADLGYEPALALVNDLKERARKGNVTDPHAVRALLHEAVQDIFKAPRRIKAINKPEVILMIGVNGVGKTTTIAKLAHRERMQGKKVLIAAADTFRAAAVEQLKVWSDRVGADFHSKPTGADPAAVAFEAMDMAVKGGYDVLFVDTAGRLQTKVNLMEELTKIRTVLGKKHQGAPHRSILVIDATTGQNALSQTKLFKEAAGVDELILTKLDGTAKGGVAIAVAMQHKIPITYVGLGEKLEDLRPFNGEDYALALLGEKEQKA